jgi:hypothetical protein
MTSQRTISLTLALLAVLVGAAPSCAFANPLLSGYGGPGAGSQAILGSTLVGGAGGGGGSAGGTSGGSPGSSAGGAAPTGSSGSRVRAGGRAADAGSGSRRASGKASAAAARAYPFSSARNASQAASAATETLGISGEDVAYIFLALGALAFTGVLTRRLARTSRLEGL